MQNKKSEHIKSLADSGQVNVVSKEILKDSNSTGSMVKNMDPENNTIYENDPENLATLKAYLK
ncbi:hypothetical protein, partial [Mycobacterium tuberculosis]|uniref:hypothetical protein n=1 Tax=Mycobacterium tuberculosis TaxID=1773 RepID=UPI002549F355